MGRFDAKRLLVEIYNDDEARALLILLADWLSHTWKKPKKRGGKGRGEKREKKGGTIPSSTLPPAMMIYVLNKISNPAFSSSFPLECVQLRFHLP